MAGLNKKKDDKMPPIKLRLLYHKSHKKSIKTGIGIFGNVYEVLGFRQIGYGWRYTLVMS